MAGKVKTPSEIEQAVTLRLAGYSVASISELTGISPATLNRHFAKLGASKGTISSEAVELARQQLLTDGSFINDLKCHVAAALLDDLSQFRQQRRALAVFVDDLLNDSTLPAHYKLRGSAAAATSLRLTSETIRRTLGIDAMPVEEAELPTLSISELTPEEITTIRANQLTEASIFDGSNAIEETENTGDVIEEF